MKKEKFEVHIFCNNDDNKSTFVFFMLLKEKITLYRKLPRYRENEKTDFIFSTPLIY